MPGFGHDPFGRWGFGESAWAYHTLWRTIPEIYRSQDASGLFQAFIEGLYPSFDNLKRKVRVLAELRDPLKVRSQYDEIERLVLGPVIVPQGNIEQTGIDGRVNALNQFTAVSGRFRETEVGKGLFVRGSAVPGNNRAVTIVQALDLNTILTDPPLAPDAGPVKWEVREKVATPTDHITVEVRGGAVGNVTPGWLLNDGLADFEVLARRQFKQLGGMAYQTEREGADGDIDGTLRFAATSGEFTPLDRGKTLSLSGSGSTENNENFEIAEVDMSTTPPRLALKGFLSEDSGPLRWALLPRAELDLYGTAIPTGVVEQEGTDLALVGGGSANVTSTTAIFSEEDEGKIIEVAGSTNAQNGPVEILTFVDPNTVTTDTAFTTAETGLYWELRSKTATGTIERAGVDAEITATDTPIVGQHTVVAPSGDFDPTEAGHSLELKGSLVSGNNTTVGIVDVIDEETLTVSGTLTVDGGPLIWELQSTSLTKQDVRAESIIKFMAPDFGLEIDTQESEARQRSLVQHVNAWLDLKGHERGYEILGTISGFDVDVFPVWRIDPFYLDTLPATSIFEVSDEATGGRSGTDGTLTIVGSQGVLYAPTAQFRKSDVGKSVRLFNADDSANNGRYHIEEWIDANTVKFRLPAPTGTVPDYGVGGTDAAPTISWVVVRFYTSSPPARPNFDEIVADELTEWIDTNPPTGDEFHVDMWCWEDTFASFVDVTVNSVTNVSGIVWEVDVTGPANVIPKDPGGGTAQPLEGPFWKLVDLNSDEFTVETAPDGSGPNYQFRVIADPTALPALGAGRLEYQCSEVPSCDFCKASVVVAEITIGSVADESGIAIERVLERVIERLTEHARPHHVRLVPRFIQILEVEVPIEVEIEANIEIFPILYAPLTAYFDDIPADDIPLDSSLRAEVVTTEALVVSGGT